VTVTTILDVDWRGVCRRIVEAQSELLSGHSGIGDRAVYEGVGEGGDRALAIDRRSEDIVFAELERIHAQGHEFVAVSEERGEVAFGRSEQRVVIDPIDGSLNARRTVPTFALSLAVASGPTIADVEVGYVYDFGAREEFWARKGRGAELGGSPLGERGPDYGLELVGIEATKPERLLPLIEGLAGKAYRLRFLGSVAISLCYVAAGRFDGMLSARHTRSVDVAAAQLIAREAGASVRLGEVELDDAGLGLDARYGVAAGLDDELLHTLLGVLPAGSQG